VPAQAPALHLIARPPGRRCDHRCTAGPDGAGGTRLSVVVAALLFAFTQALIWIAVIPGLTAKFADGASVRQRSASPSSATRCLSAIADRQSSQMNAE